MDEVKDELGIEMNYSTKGDHEHEAERNIETIKERVRTGYHYMPYPALPNILTKHLCMASTDQLNLFPAKGGVSAYFSPHVIMTGQNFDYNKHCQVPLGAYVQANEANDPTNINAPRTIDAIYLRPMPNTRQGGHLVMNLATRRQTTATKVVELPITEHVIKAVAKMAEEQGDKSLKITGRNKQILHPAHWVAGVDYDNNNENQSENEEENDEDFIPDEETYPEDDNMVKEDCYDQIDQAEIDEIFADSGRSENNSSNPTDDKNNTAENPENSEQLSDDDGSDTEDQNQTANQPTTRYGRTIKQRNILTYGHLQNNTNQRKQPPKKNQ